eukprot:TRINITY_DN36427_c0_g1_i1.p1 TRINITY_DN36427_c0_g1~~TRINITY_DN36427_c0_g1_i1.p1  ORF type:complete len:371 (+),score=91.96 TRINITY_DN36427_c0_g1_i1:47-1114(+)
MAVAAAGAGRRTVRSGQSAPSGHGLLPPLAPAGCISEEQLAILNSAGATKYLSRTFGVTLRSTPVAVEIVSSAGRSRVRAADALLKRIFSDAERVSAPAEDRRDGCAARLLADHSVLLHVDDAGRAVLYGSKVCRDAAVEELERSGGGRATDLSAMPPEDPFRPSFERSALRLLAALHTRFRQLVEEVSSTTAAPVRPPSPTRSVSVETGSGSDGGDEGCDPVLGSPVGPRSLELDFKLEPRDLPGAPSPERGHVTPVPFEGVCTPLAMKQPDRPPKRRRREEGEEAGPVPPNGALAAMPLPEVRDLLKLLEGALVSGQHRGHTLSTTPCPSRWLQTAAAEFFAKVELDQSSCWC